MSRGACVAGVGVEPLFAFSSSSNLSPGKKSPRYPDLLLIPGILSEDTLRLSCAVMPHLRDHSGALGNGCKPVDVPSKALGFTEAVSA